MEAISYLDGLVKEYLLFRGFSKTVTAFQSDSKADPGLGYQAEQLTDHLFQVLIPQLRADDLASLLRFLQAHVFSKLAEDLGGSAEQIEDSLLRCFVITALQKKKPHKVQELFQLQGEALLTGSRADRWSVWYGLPYLKDPQHDPRFQVYFTAEWSKMVEVSFQNFISEAMLQLPLPALLRFHADRQQRQHLQAQVAQLQGEVDRLRTQLSQVSESHPAASLQPVAQLTRHMDMQYMQPGRKDPLAKPLAQPPVSAGLHRPPDQQVPAVRPPHHGNSPPAARTAQAAALAPAAPNSSRAPTAVEAAAGNSSTAHAAGTVTQQLPLEVQSAPIAVSGTHTLPEDEPSTATLSASASEAALSGDASGMALRALTEPGSNSTSRSASLSAASVGSPHSNPSLLAPSTNESGTTGTVQGPHEWLQGHDKPVHALAFSADGSNLASGDAAGVVRIWAPVRRGGNAGRVAVLLCGAAVTALAWDARTDKVMLVGTQGKGMKAWHADTKRMVSQVRLDAAAPDVLALAISPLEPVFACVAGTWHGRHPAGSLSLWNMRTFRKVHPLTLPGNRAAASVCYSPDGSVVAASTPDGCICVVQVGSRTAIATLRACTGSPVPPLVGFGASGVLYSVCGNRLQEWAVLNMQEPQHECEMNSHATALAISPSAALAATAEDQSVHLIGWDWPEESNKSSVAAVPDQLLMKHASVVTCLIWHPVVATVASACTNGAICMTEV